MQLNRPGDGIHGCPNAETIGRTGSHGCIRLANWDAAIIWKMVTTGTPVTIESDETKVAVGD
jgi:lipoprotein-anchoring transpeptidase ErfK/SrfK